MYFQYLFIFTSLSLFLPTYLHTPDVRVSQSMMLNKSTLRRKRYWGINRYISAELPQSTRKLLNPLPDDRNALVKKSMTAKKRE